MKKFVFIWFFLASVVFSTLGYADDKGWFAINGPCPFLEPLKQHVDAYYQCGLDRSSNIAAFSIYVNDVCIFDSDVDTSFIFYSSDADPKDAKLGTKETFKMMDGAYSAPSFFAHQQKIIASAKNVILKTDGLLGELNQYENNFIKPQVLQNIDISKSIIDIFEKPREDFQFVFAFINGSKNADTGDVANIDNKILQQLQVVVKSFQTQYNAIEKAFKVHHEKLKQLFHSEQRILYYLLRHDGERFREIIQPIASKSSTDIALYLHTHKDPCPICGSVLAFSRTVFENIINEVFGKVPSRPNFQLVVSCSVIRDELLKEEGLIKKQDTQITEDDLLIIQQVRHDNKSYGTLVTRLVDELAKMKESWWSNKLSSPNQVPPRYPLYFLGNFKDI
ncbi:MAG: hypothetical protein LBF43_03330 [Puniceicoccales bacterium]|jgi:hypothetical protein|nr:hypothetical protein [Puniceicoccales bacterium]